MDKDIVIRVEDLGKRYTLGPQSNERYTTLRDSVANSVQGLLGRQRQAKDQTVDPEEFWALRDVSFEIKRGDVVGVIGRNGAGKSTLLKILSRITEPTAGRITLKGRVASLLEVGTGFHPELTGRENIYLNGAILGMHRSEIRTKFDEIVAFAEVERFLDTPVKRYSSGMYVRLAFAVAAHLEPEILIVDEVLAVGDASFQKKCLSKIEEAGETGQTILLVSHSMPTVTRIANRAILLNGGTIIKDGPTGEVTHAYLTSGTDSSAERKWDKVSAPGDSVAKLRSVRVLGEGDVVVSVVPIDKPLHVEVEYDNMQAALRVTAILHFINSAGICLFATNEFEDPRWWTRPIAPGLIRSRCTVPGNFLTEGPILLLAALGTYNPNVVHALVQDAASFTVVEAETPAAFRRIYSGDWPGVVRPSLNWESSVL